MSANSQLMRDDFRPVIPSAPLFQLDGERRNTMSHRDWIRGLVARRFLVIADPKRRPQCVCGVTTIVVLMLACFAMTPFASAATSSEKSKSRQPDFGPNVYIFNPSMPLSQIQTTVDSIATQQLSNQFGTQRYALLFEPGTFGSSTTPLNFQVGYYTSVAGLGQSPGNVVINGSVDVHNQCTGSNCIALVNFWRSLSNLTINVTNPTFGCYTGEFWAVSQAAPMRRVLVNGAATLMDYCTGPSFASGGFIADSQFEGGSIVSGSQQQWLTRNSIIDGWSNGVWNQVFSGVVGAPAQCFPVQASSGDPYTTLATSSVTREAPYLYQDSRGNYKVFVPAVQHESSGTTWQNGETPGSSIPVRRFFIAQPTDSAEKINRVLFFGFDLILTPGVYKLDRSIEVTRPDTVVVGLGFPTLIPENGNASITVASDDGVLISGIIFDAGAKNSPVLLQVGCEWRTATATITMGQTRRVFTMSSFVSAALNREARRSVWWSTATTSSGMTSGARRPRRRRGLDQQHCRYWPRHQR